MASIALGLLAASGTAKLIDPAPTTGAMRAARLPAGDLLTYALGACEIVVGLGGLALGGVTAGAAALLYAGFTVFTFAAVRKRIPIQSCGCFGREDTPPSVIHVAYDATAAAAIGFVALNNGPVDWAMPSLDLVLYLGFAAVGVVASYFLMTRLPQVLALARATP